MKKDNQKELLAEELKKLSSEGIDYNLNDEFAIWCLGEFESSDKEGLIQFILEMIFTVGDIDQTIEVYNSQKNEFEEPALSLLEDDPIVKFAKELNVKLPENDFDDEEERFEWDLEDKLRGLSSINLIYIANKYLKPFYSTVGTKEVLIEVELNDENGLMKILNNVDKDLIIDSVQKSICDSFSKRYNK